MSITVNNLQPHQVIGLPFVIPAGQSSAIQTFNGLSISLKDTDYNYIPYISCRIDTSGIYNITTTEIVNINGVPTTILPGNYSLANLISIFHVTIPTSGAGSLFATTTQTLQFTANSQAAFILGFTSFGTSLIGVGVTGTQQVNQTANNDTILIQCDIIGPSSALGSNYLAVFNLSNQSPNTIFFDRIFITPPTPIIVSNFSQITWTLLKFDGTPFICETPVEIFYRIGIQKKLCP